MLVEKCHHMWPLCFVLMCNWLVLIIFRFSSKKEVASVDQR